MPEKRTLPKFAVLQLSGCAGCEVSLINASEWVDQYQLVYMPLVVSANAVPEDTEILLVSGGVRNDEDAFNLRKAAKTAKRVVAVGTCAISGGVSNLGDRDDVRKEFLAQSSRHHLPHLLPKSHPIDTFVDVDLYLPGCPPTPELFMAALTGPEKFPGQHDRLPGMRAEEAQRHASQTPGRLPAGRSPARYMPDQPGLPVRRFFHPGRLPCDLHEARPSLRGLPRSLQRLY